VNQVTPASLRYPLSVFNKNSILKKRVTWCSEVVGDPFFLKLIYSLLTCSWFIVRLLSANMFQVDVVVVIRNCLRSAPGAQPADLLRGTLCVRKKKMERGKEKQLETVKGTREVWNEGCCK